MLLQCPACRFDLEEVSVGGVVVDLCKQGCGGIWLDQFELRKIHSSNADLRGLIERINFDLEAMAANSDDRSCPRCSGTALARQPADAGRSFCVDECPACGGVFLDYGELQSIRRAAANLESMSQAILRQLSAKTD